MKKSIALIIILLSFLVLAAYLFFNENGFLREIKFNKEIRGIQSAIDSTNTRIANLKKEIDSLKTSKTKIERVARERYNFRAKDEKVLDIEIK